MKRNKQGIINVISMFLLFPTLAATISFFASAAITSMVLSPLDFAIIDTIFAGGLGGLFLLEY